MLWLARLAKLSERAPVHKACTHCSCRFDVLCVVRDIVDPVQDQRLAEFVVGSHARSHPDGAEDDQQQQQVQPQDPDILPQDLLRKYIAFAKQQIRPSLSSVSAGCLLLLVRCSFDVSRAYVGHGLLWKHLVNLLGFPPPRLSMAPASFH